MPLHLSEFQNPEFQGFVENIPRKRDYKLEDFLPSETTKDINFAYAVINGEYAKAASITGFNASAPLRDPMELSKAFGSVAKIQHGFRLDEEQLMRFNRPRDDEEMNQVIEYVYQNTEMLTEGVQDIEEFLRAQAVYNGKLEYKDSQNDIELNVDFGIPSENKLEATKKWDDEGAEPLEDIRNAVEQFKDQNQRRKPTMMHMTSKTEANLLRNEQIRIQVYGTENGKKLLTKDDLSNVFNALGFPDYEINDDVVNAGDEGEQQLLDDGKVVFLGGEIGKTYFGPTVEKEYESGVYVVTNIRETNPPEQSVFVGETAFPAIQRPKSIVTMSV